MKNPYAVVFLILALLMVIMACEEKPTEPDPQRTRENAIPADAVKMTPATDIYPPVCHSADWEQPVPMPGPVNTAGAEDAPVISPDGTTFIFFWTPDVDVPPEKQLIDGVTGVWWCRFEQGEWTEPQRAVLNDDLALDGPVCLEGSTLWFVSARLGNLRELDVYTAERSGNVWTNWQNAGELLNIDYRVGELYITGDGATMYYHSNMDSGLGGTDIWKINKIDDKWQPPVNLGPVINTALDEGWLYISQNGSELWFTRWSSKGYAGPAIFRSRLVNGHWSVPEEIISNFAGDPGLDAEGNIYYTHHFFNSEGKMIEADIYVAYRK